MKNNKRAGALYFALGALFLAAALALVIYNFAQQQTAQTAVEDTMRALTAAVAERSLPDEAEDTPADAPEEALDELQPLRTMPVVTVGGYDYIGWLTLPSLGLELPVMSEWSYARLKIAPCRYTGSAYSGDMVLAAHNFSSHFGRLSELSPGDEVLFTDVEGNVFRYEVADAEILQPTAVEEMTAGEWPLTLFTCTYGGRTRLTIRCAAAE